MGLLDFRLDNCGVLLFVRKIWGLSGSFNRPLLLHHPSMLQLTT